MVKTAFFTKDVRCLLENVPFLPKTLGIKKYRQQMTSKLPANKKSRQRKAEEGVDSLG
ncbi:hypothetical protein [Phascolarctobacterium succinatutens]|uniref:hypothetical protein n=1 Tax=Phascolarctobacterium succinatutens TaxID=626940 RepID=UPI00402576F9